MGDERNYVAEPEGEREQCANNAAASGMHQTNRNLRWKHGVVAGYKLSILLAAFLGCVFCVWE